MNLAKDNSADVRYVDALIAQRENTALEFKAAVSTYDRDKAVGYCAAIANEGGGLFVLGISDKLPREVVGSAAFKNPVEFEHFIYEKLQVRVPIREADYHGKRVLVFQIPGRSLGLPIAFDGRYLMRSGESLVPMNAHSIAAIIAESQGPALVRPVLSDLGPAEVEAILDVEAYFKLIPDSRPDGLEDRLDCLAARSLLKVALRAVNYEITTLGALFLAKDLSNIPALKLRRIRLIKYSGADRVNAIFEKFENRGYGIAFDDLLELVNSHVPVREIIRGGLRETLPIYPPTAIREFLANALVHQDLGEAGVQLTIEIFSDRLEFRNPGEPLIDVNRFVDETRSRNPELAEIMRVARICEVRGSGVDRALEQIEDYFQPAPLFRAGTAATTVTLFAHLEFADMTIEERVWTAFLHCSVKYQAGSRLTNTSLRERFALAQGKTALVSQTIAAAIDSGLIKTDPRVGSSKRHARYVPFFA